MVDLPYKRTPQAIHCREIGGRQPVHEAPHALLPHDSNPRRVALAIILVGEGFDQERMFLALNDIAIPAEKELYAQQKIVCKAIIDLANESCEQAKMETPQGTVISFDGAWEHRRNAPRCMMTVFSQQTRKVLSWKIVGRKFPRLDKRFCTVSQNMEVHALRLIIPEMNPPGLDA
jgi:hypothetical protein